MAQETFRPVDYRAEAEEIISNEGWEPENFDGITQEIRLTYLRKYGEDIPLIAEWEEDLPSEAEALAAAVLLVWEAEEYAARHTDEDEDEDEDEV